MRKLLWIAAVMLAALVFAACGDDGDEQPAQGGESTPAESPGADLNLQTEGQLTVGAEFPVPGFLELPIENPTGFEVDFAEALAEELGVPEVKWVNTPFSGLFSPAPKRFDMAINEITITDQRARVVDFSEPYFDANQGFLVHKGGPAEGVTSIADMKGLQFGFQATTTGGDFIKNEIQPDKQPREYSTLGAATRALANGQIDAFLMDVAIGVNIVEDLPEQVAMTGQFETGEQYGVLFEKDNPLREQVNQAITAITDSGRLKEMQDEWFPGTAELAVLK